MFPGSSVTSMRPSGATAAAAASYVRMLRANARIQVGVIGCGNLGMLHLRLYLKPILDEGKARVAAVCVSVLICFEPFIHSGTGNSDLRWVAASGTMRPWRLPDLYASLR